MSYRKGVIYVGIITISRKMPFVAALKETELLTDLSDGSARSLDSEHSSCVGCQELCRERKGDLKAAMKAESIEVIPTL